MSDESRVELVAKLLWDRAPHDLLKAHGHPVDWESQPESIKRPARRDAKAVIEALNTQSELVSNLRSQLAEAKQFGLEAVETGKRATEIAESLHQSDTQSEPSEPKNYESDGLIVTEDGNPIAETYLRMDAIRLAADLNRLYGPTAPDELVREIDEMLSDEKAIQLVDKDFLKDVKSRLAALTPVSTKGVVISEECADGVLTLASDGLELLNQMMKLTGAEPAESYQRCVTAHFEFKQALEESKL